MQATISRWGNSLALRIPSHVTKEAGLVEGTFVQIDVEDGSFRVTPTRKKFKLADLIAGHTKSDEELDWGQPKGEEAW
jgi:antitoxin MazE